MLEEQPILLVEDDLVGVMTVKRAFRQRGVSNPLYTAGNGIEALKLLEKTTDADEAVTRPGLILLDLNMPLMNGIEFLTKLRERSLFQTIPVVVLTTSRNDTDLERCYRLGISGYIVKPVRFHAFLEVTRALEEFFTLCAVPRKFPE